MASPVWLTGFEYGVATPVTSGGGLWNAVTGAPTIQGTTKRTGGYALRVNVTTAAATNVARTISTATLVGSVYFMLRTEPSAVVRILRFTTAAGTSPAIYYDPADNKIYPSISTAGTKSAAALSLETWHRIDFKVVVGPGGTSTLDVQLDGVAIAQKTFDQTATTMNGCYLGFMDAVTGEVFYDDVILSYTAGDYPIGPSGVQGLSPSADGTHNAGTNVMENQAGADIGVVTAYDLVNSVPIGDATTYIRQAINGTGNYAEVVFADITHSHASIIGAMALLAYRGATTTANRGACIVSKDSFATSTTLWGSIASTADYSETTVFYKSVIVAGAVDDTTVNALKARMGYSGDADPDPWWVDLMVEVAYTISAGSSNPISLAGAITPGGTVSKQDNKTLRGATTPGGAMLKQIVKTLRGGLTPAGMLLKRAQKALAGAVTFVGLLVKGVGYPRSFAGSVASAGTVVRQTGKALTGAVSTAGQVVRRLSKTVAGSIASAGALTYIRAVSKLFAGSISATGTLTRRASKTLAGSLASGGTLTKRMSKTLAGTITPGGVIILTKAILRTFSGAVASAGSLSKRAGLTLSGAVTGAGQMVRQARKTIGGTLAPSGAITTARAVLLVLTGAILAAGSVTKRLSATFAGVVSTAGQVSKSITTRLSGAVASIGGLVQSVIAGVTTPGNMVTHFSETRILHTSENRAAQTSEGAEMYTGEKHSVKQSEFYTTGFAEKIIIWPSK